LHLHEGRLHHDGGKAIEWSDGWGLWSLHGVTVPQWLAETASEKIDPHRILEIENSQVRAEFARKVGLERMWYTLKGRVIEARTVTLKTPGNPAWECAYKLVELDFGNGERPRALVMPNASLPDVMHVEYVPGTCQTVYQAINFRLGRKPEDVREDGEPYWLHGDVILRPKGATSWRPWPELIA